MHLFKIFSSCRQVNTWNKIQPRDTPKQPGFRLFLLIGAAIPLILAAGCEKNKEDIDFTRAYNKKWQNVSAVPDPVWTDPSTGRSYPELVLFNKEKFPCVTDDYAVYYPDGTTVSFRGTERCYPAEPEKSSPGTYTFNTATDSLILEVPFEVPGQPATTTVIRSKVLELTNGKMVLRFNQILPFTNSLHMITYTYKAIP